MNALPHNPSVADLAAILPPDLIVGDPTADPDATIHQVLHAEEDRGLVRRWGVSMQAWVIEWTWHSSTRGPRKKTATVIEVGQGGGDQAFIHQVAVGRALTTEEASVIADLASHNALPVTIAQGEI